MASKQPGKQCIGPCVCRTIAAGMWDGWQPRQATAERAPEGPHGHAEASQDGPVDLVGVQAQVDQQAGRLRAEEQVL